MLLLTDYVDGTEQVKGAALVPKRVLNVMDGEVNRLLILTSTAIIPTPVIVPRKVRHLEIPDIYMSITIIESRNTRHLYVNYHHRT